MRRRLLRCGISIQPMTGPGQSRRFGDVCDTSARPPTTAVMMQAANGRKVPGRDIRHGSPRRRDHNADETVAGHSARAERSASGSICMYDRERTRGPSHRTVPPMGGTSDGRGRESSQGVVGSRADRVADIAEPTRLTRSRHRPDLHPAAPQSPRTEVCYPFGRKHGRHRAMRRRDFIKVIGGAAAAGRLRRGRSRASGCGASACSQA